jgi:hypothetical protein
MKIKENITLYKCDFCKKELKRKHAMENHESLCLRNPINFRPCYSCPMLIKKETSVYYDHYDGSESERKVNLLYCEYKKHFLYTPKNEAKKNAFELGDDYNEPMPKECDFEPNNTFPWDI